jgi:uncharacterized membrane protein
MTDERLERMIAALLRAGVILSAVVVLLGGLCYLVRHGSEPADYRTFHGAPAQYRTLSGVVAQRDCRAVIQLGLLLLIATPIARVAFSLVAFGMERDRIYVVVTTIVLIILLYSLHFTP